MRLLFVSDDDQMVDEWVQHFRRRGHEATGCRDRREAVAELHAGGFHTVVADLEMLGENNFQLLSHIRQRNGMTYVIALVGQVSLELFLAGMRFGINECLFKPVHEWAGLDAAVEASSARHRYWQTMLKQFQEQRARIAADRQWLPVAPLPYGLEHALASFPGPHAGGRAGGGRQARA